MYELVIPSSFQVTTLAVDSLDFCTAKLQSENEKMSLFFSSNEGKILSFSLSFTFPEHPYMKTFFFLEWPCKSQTRKVSLSSCIFLISILVLYTVGCCFLLGSLHHLFRSTPASEHLEFPLITPSGLSIGTILNSKLSLKILALRVGPVR